MELMTVVLAVMMTLTAESMAFIFPEYFDSGMDSCIPPHCSKSTEKKSYRASKQIESPEVADACPVCTDDDYESCPVDLPADCQPGYAVCGCCAECRGQLGDTCSPTSVGCAFGLLCATEDGLSPISMPIWLDFQGTCQLRKAVEVVEVTGTTFPDNSKSKMSHLRRTLRYLTLKRKSKMAKEPSTFW